MSASSRAVISRIDPVKGEEEILAPLESESTIGSSPSAGIRLDDLRCSGIHALIERIDNDEYILIDLGSHFGTYVKGRRIRETKLRSGDEFKIGQQILKISPLKDPNQNTGEIEARAKAETSASTRVEPKTPLVTDLRILEISLYWGEQLLDLRTFKPGAVITLGNNRDATFEVVLPEMERGQKAYKIAQYEKGMVSLNLPPSATGLVWIGGETHALDSLRHRQQESEAFDGHLHTHLRIGDRASIELGELTLVFNFVTPSPKLPRFLRPVLDKTLLKILGGLSLFYLLLFLVLSFGDAEEKEKTLADVPKHLKKVLYNAGIEQARKVQEAAIGQIAQNLEGGRARLEEGSASASKVAVEKKQTPKQERSKSEQNVKTPDQQTAPKKAETKTPPKPVTVDLNSAFATATSTSDIVNAAKNSDSSAAKAQSGNTAAALMQGGFARGNVGLGAGGGGKGVGIGQLKGSSTGGGMGAGDYGLEPSKGREIAVSEEEEIVILGGLDPDVIAAIIRRYLSQIRNCYEQQLITNPDLKGKVTVSFVIGGDGFVKKAEVAETTLHNPPTEQCIVSRVLKWKFPKPMGGGSVGVKYPFLLMSNSGE